MDQATIQEGRGGGVLEELVHFGVRIIESESLVLLLLTWCLDANLPDMSNHRGK